MSCLPLRALPWLAAALLSLAGCSSSPVALQGPATTVQAAPKATACPAGLPPDATCLAGQDSAGAFYLIAKPAHWDGVLILHAHGGPLLSAPSPQRAAEDLQRWAVMVRAGHAWAGTTFHQGGMAVRAAAEDTERLRGIFVQHVGVPRRTILHGQSWGAGVAAKAAEMFTAHTVGATPYDGVLLSSGVLGGGSHAYDFRLDLRVLYQSLCHNHPRPTEPAYAPRTWCGSA